MGSESDTRQAAGVTTSGATSGVTTPGATSGVTTPGATSGVTTSDTGESAEPDAGGARPDAGGSEPDVRFTFANERTFLAWNRTALALVVAGLAVAQLLPPFPGIPWGRHLLAVPLIVFGGVLSVSGYVEWGRNQLALRRGRPLPRSPLPRILALTIVGVSAIATVLVVLSVVLRP